jgi:hypothetical protein
MFKINYMERYCMPLSNVEQFVVNLKPLALPCLGILLVQGEVYCLPTMRGLLASYIPS